MLWGRSVLSCFCCRITWRTLLVMPCLPFVRCFQGLTTSDIDPRASRPPKTSTKQRASPGGVDSLGSIKRIENLRTVSPHFGDSEMTVVSSGSALDVTVGYDVPEGGTVSNFRAARGLNDKIFRCGNTDDLFHRVEVNQDAAALSEAEDLLLRSAGLILDLRSPSERSSRRSRVWMSQAPGGSFDVQRGKFEFREPRQERTALRLDPLSPDRFYKYVDEHWFSPQQKAQATMFKLLDGASLDKMRIDALNSRGLVGLYEAILETGRNQFLEALKAITLHLEAACEEEGGPKKPVVINCVKGKDRTGLLVMLCQSILGVSDEDIIEDYALSDKCFDPSSKTSGIPSVKTGVLDRIIFGRAPPEAMEGTLVYIRTKYQSVDGYLDSIGFDKDWRARFTKVVKMPQADVSVV